MNDIPDMVWLRRHGTFDEVVESCGQSGILATWSDGPRYSGDSRYVRHELFAEALQEMLELKLELNALRKSIKDIDSMVDIQCSDGNWNYDEYMFGLANGLLMASHVMHDCHDEPLLNRPEKFIHE